MAPLGVPRPGGALVHTLPRDLMQLPALCDEVGQNGASLMSDTL